VAHATSSILEYYDMLDGSTNRKLSTNFIYGLEKKLFGNDSKGMYLRNACEIVKDYGCPEESFCAGNKEVPEVNAIAAKEESTLWPVHNPFGPSYEFVECADEEEAREFIMWSENHSAYEYNNNL
jgi:hypothetical protein